MKKKPNVVIVMTDDQGYGDIGRHGNENIFTPNLDKLYDESYHLVDFHMSPSCAPSRAGLLTAQYANRVNVWHTVGGRSILRKDVETMGGIFKRAGYNTACVGKWHLGDSYPYRAQDKGFDKVLIHRGGGIGQAPDYWANDYFSNVFFENGVDKKFDGYCTDVFFNESIKFMEAHKDEPFLLYLAPNAPHYPLRVEEKYYNLYKDKMPEDRARCYGMLTNVDDNIGKMRKYLKDNNLEDNTIFLYMSDNGGEFGFKLDRQGFVAEGYNAGMRGMKCGSYEGGHRVPCFIHYPNGGMNHAKDIRNCTTNMDIIPTLMELCDFKDDCSKEFDGKSIVDIITSDIEVKDDRIMVVDSQRMNYPMKWKTCTVMKDKWRLVDRYKLYDLNTDPEQRNNIYEQNPETALELTNAYEKWWEHVSVHFNDDIPISIGSEFENPVYLSCHDWRGSEINCVWNQGDIRKGYYKNSYLEILVERDGEYEIELRRWPKELNLEITAGIEGDLGNYSEWYQGGKALPITESALEIQGFRYQQSVTNEDKSITYKVNLKKGQTHLRTFFYASDGGQLGAYYTYVNYCGR